MLLGLEGIHDSLDSLFADTLAIGNAEQIDDVFRIAIVNDSYLQNITLQN